MALAFFSPEAKEGVWQEKTNEGKGVEGASSSDALVGFCDWCGPVLCMWTPKFLRTKGQGFEDLSLACILL